MGKPPAEADFYFNYRSDENEIWDDNELRSEWRYRTVYLEPSGLTVELT